MKRALIVILLLCGLVMYSYFGRRPMFSTWELGEMGWHWKANYLIDDNIDGLLIDPHLNILVLIKAPAKITSLHREADQARIVFQTPKKHEVSIPDSPNRLFIYSEQGGLTQYTIPSRVAECVLSEHFHPRGYTERKISDSIVKCCTQDCGEILAAIKD